MEHYDSSASMAPLNFLEMSRDCSACAETKPLHEITHIDDSPVCHDCVREMFKNAIQNESNYPPRWGSITLDVHEYAYIIGATMASDFIKKLREYRTPWLNRVYCRLPNEEGAECATFLGRRMALGQHNTSKSCHTCGKKTCRVCKEEIIKRGNHDCKPTPREDIPGLERGKVSTNHISAPRPPTSRSRDHAKTFSQDYQKCPGCDECIELREGCVSLRDHDPLSGC